MSGNGFDDFNDHDDEERDPSELFAGVLEEDANDPFVQHDYDDHSGHAEFIDGAEEALKREQRAHDLYPQDDLARVVHTDIDSLDNAKEVIDNAPVIDGAPPTAIRGIMGGEVAVSSSDSTPRSIASWVGEIDAESRMVTVAFGPTPQITTQSASAGQLRAFVRVRYGTQRGFLYIDADVGAGGMLSVPASAVEVLFGVDSGGTPVSNYTLTCAIAFGRLSRTAQLTRTAYLDAMAGGAVVNITRPIGAITVVDFQRADPSAQYQLQFLDVQSNIKYTRIIAPNDYLSYPIYLSNDIVSVQVTNNGSSTDQARIIFGLSVG
jgi:hypothetical protein